MRCGNREQHEWHEQPNGLSCMGVSADKAIFYAVMDAANDYVMSLQITGKPVPPQARMEMNPQVMAAVRRCSPAPTLAPLDAVLTIPVVVVPGLHGWRLIIASGTVL